MKEETREKVKIKEFSLSDFLERPVDFIKFSNDYLNYLEKYDDKSKLN